MKSDKGQTEFVVKPDHISYGASTSWIVILLITASVRTLKRSSEASKHHIRENKTHLQENSCTKNDSKDKIKLKFKTAFKLPWQIVL